MCVLVYSNGWTALHWAASEGHFDVVSELLKHNAKVDVKDKYVAFFCLFVYTHAILFLWLYIVFMLFKYFIFLLSFVF